jgi:hypothetical protein
MEIFEYWLLLRDAVIYNYMQYDEGRKYLDNCYRMGETKPNREKLREQFKK